MRAPSGDAAYSTQVCVQFDIYRDQTRSVSKPRYSGHKYVEGIYR